MVELVVAIAIFMIYAGGLTVASTNSYLTRFENAKLAQASLFFEEGWEAVKIIRNDDWSKITNGNHGLSSSGNSWNFSGSFDTYNNIDRTITVSDVRRNDSGDIVSSGGEVDPDTKRIAIEVTWSPIATKNLSLHAQSYLTNYQNADVWPPPPPEPPPEP